MIGDTITVRRGDGAERTATVLGHGPGGVTYVRIHDTDPEDGRAWDHDARITPGPATWNGWQIVEPEAETAEGNQR